MNLPKLAHNYDAIIDCLSCVLTVKLITNTDYAVNVNSSLYIDTDNCVSGMYTHALATVIILHIVLN